jgi:hypothetical protein
MRQKLSAGVLASLLFASGNTLHAQGTSLLVMPRAGVIRQALPLTQQFILAPDFRTKWRYEMDAAPIVGALIEVPTPLKSLAVRLEASQAGRSDIRKAEGSDGPPTYGEVTAEIQIASIAAVFQPPRFCRGGVCPRLLGGGGIKRYNFTGNLLWDDIVDRFADDQSHATLQLGAGIVAYVSRLAIIVEVMDYSNGINFASRDQPTDRAHDLSFNLGAGVRF